MKIHSWGKWHHKKKSFVPIINTDITGHCIYYNNVGSAMKSNAMRCRTRRQAIWLKVERLNSATKSHYPIAISGL
jgi:hypothetical protein